MLRRAPTRVEIKNDDLDELLVAARSRAPGLNPLQESLEVEFETHVTNVKADDGDQHVCVQSKHGNSATRDRIGITAQKEGRR
jgi:hypothetical protein